MTGGPTAEDSPHDMSSGVMDDQRPKIRELQAKSHGWQES
jgi:hypothetical protein